jgi:transposase InsO family protein
MIRFRNEPLQHQLAQKGHYGYQYILRQGYALQQQAIFTTPYNPNANGFAENQNRTIKDMLSAYVNDQQIN